MKEIASLENRVKNILHEVGRIIHNRRIERGMTMSQLAEKAGVGSSSISDLENFKNVMPNILTLMRIANGLELPEDEFLKIISTKITRRNNDEELNVLNKLKSVLIEYGLPPVCLNRILDYVDYYKSLYEVENAYKIINLIYEQELQNGSKMEQITIDPLLILEAKQNIDRIEKIKADLQDKSK